MRWLGVDAGEARVGIAACDAEERVAVPLEVVLASAAFPAIRAIAAREGVGGIVVGLPLHADGGEGEAVRMARRLGDRLARALAIPVEYEDERFSSAEAQAPAEAGRGARSARPRDDLAAAVILQRFIDRRRGGRGAPP
ncbi:MAG: Holliday junction resolvase RuvX [Dehalococcoidia bacterium]|nr:Holliday junction resolvase RuvX [Dehalococcoidia bacterium]